MRRSRICRLALAATILAGGLGGAAELPLIGAAPAHASGDYGCDTQWSAINRDPGSCGNGAMLAPGNDTRANMLMLLADRRGVAGAIPAGARFNPEEPYALYDPYSINTRSPQTRWFVFASRFAAMDADDGEDASSCASNASGARAFINAVKSARGISAIEAVNLVEARQKLLADCRDLAAIEASGAGMVSPPARQLHAYLLGAARFYAGDMAGADAQFVAAAKSDLAWVKEAAIFMQARIAIWLLRDAALDQYGGISAGKKPDAGFVRAAQSALSDYLKAYPAGVYRSSAVGLQRRIHWLAQDGAQLAQAYALLLARRDTPGAPPSDVHLVEEIDLKMLPAIDPATAADPILLASISLAMMRSEGYWGDGSATGKKLTRATLDAQRPLFASAPALYEFLQASFAFHVEKDPRTALKLIPDAARQPAPGYLQFSRQMLRGQALDALKDPNAAGFWAELAGSVTNPVQRDMLDLAIAMQAERSGQLDRVIGPKSLVKNPLIRETIIKYGAGAPMLRGAAQDRALTQQERDAALFTLLYKQVSRGRYADFVRDLALVPAGAKVPAEGWGIGRVEFPAAVFLGSGSHKNYPCPTLKETATRLSTQPQSSSALLCLADFMRVRGFDGSELDTPPPGDTLGGAVSQFPGKPFSRMTIYQQIIASPSAPANDRAYALYRAVMCYAPAGISSCRGADVSRAQRKAWFDQLKRQYPASFWAKDLKFYW